jgi:DNA-directed RNA polymerase specialized sigma subunit
VELNDAEIFDANSAVIEYEWIARCAARKYSDYPKVEFEDLQQIALIGMIEGSRQPMPEWVEDFKVWMMDCAYKSVRKHLQKTTSTRRRIKNIWTRPNNHHNRTCSRPLVELSPDARVKSPDSVLSEDEWWKLVTFHLSQEERRYVELRFQNSLSIQETSGQMGISTFRACEIEMAILPVCGAAIKKLKGYGDLGTISGVPSFRLRKSDFSNGKPIIDETSGVAYTTISALARYIGCKCTPLSRALKSGAVEFEGKRYRYATEGESEQIRKRASEVAVRIDKRATAIVHLDTGNYYHSVQQAAADLGLNASSLWKSMNMGRKRGELHGHRFRYATEEEMEHRQKAGNAA